MKRSEARAWVLEGFAFWLRGCNAIRLKRDSFPVFNGYTMDELMTRRRKTKLKMRQTTNGIHPPHIPTEVNRQIAVSC